MRITFEQATRDVVANAQLFSIVEDDTATPWNWKKASKVDFKNAERIVDNLCDDLTLITEHRIKRFSNLKIAGRLPPWSDKQCASWYWNTFLHNFPEFVNNTVSRINNYAGSSCIYPMSHLYWRGNTAKVILPSDSPDKQQTIVLSEPVEITLANVDKPPHIQRKLELLEQTHYDYQPYALRGKNGEQLLVLKLGCQWHDIVVATWHEYNVKNVAAALMWCSVCCLLSAFACCSSMLYSVSFGLSWWACLSGLVVSSGLASLFFGSFLTERSKTIKV